MHVAASLLGHQEVRVAEHSQVLRHRPLGDIHPVGKRADAQGPASEQLYDPDAAVRGQYVADTGQMPVAVHAVAFILVTANILMLLPRRVKRRIKKRRSRRLRPGSGDKSRTRTPARSNPFRIALTFPARERPRPPVP